VIGQHPQSSGARACARRFRLFPRSLRFAIFRSFVDCDPEAGQAAGAEDRRNRGGTGACFKLLHDAYVSEGFMKPGPSGLRATIYHALPTTTTLCAKVDGKVVGTLSLIRESVFGFPLQAIFDLTEIGRGAARSPRSRRWRCTRTSARPAARSCSR
jgi:hypothetical protein